MTNDVVMESGLDTEESLRRKVRPRHLALIATGVVAGIMLAGFGIASAQTSSSSPRPDEAFHGRTRAGAFRRFPGPGHPGRGLGMLHGEGVVRSPGGAGAFETVALQSGKVMTVGDGSIKVASADGFTRSYAITSDTKLFPMGEKIGDVGVGDEVRVSAVVNGDQATAKRIVDITDRPASTPGGPSGSGPAGAPGAAA